MLSIEICCAKVLLANTEGVKGIVFPLLRGPIKVLPLYEQFFTNEKPQRSSVGVYQILPAYQPVINEYIMICLLLA